MIWLLAHWKLLSGAVAGILLAGYVGWLNVQLASERATVAMLDADLAVALGNYETCDARLTNILERINSDASVPDDLDGFPVNPDWLLPPD